MSAEYLCHDRSAGVEWFGAEAPKAIGESEGANSDSFSSRSFFALLLLPHQHLGFELTFLPDKG